MIRANASDEDDQRDNLIAPTRWIDWDDDDACAADDDLMCLCDYFGRFLHKSVDGAVEDDENGGKWKWCYCSYCRTKELMSASFGLGSCCPWTVRNIELHMRRCSSNDAPTHSRQLNRKLRACVCVCVFKLCWKSNASFWNVLSIQRKMTQVAQTTGSDETGKMCDGLFSKQRQSRVAHTIGRRTKTMLMKRVSQPKDQKHRKQKQNDWDDVRKMSATMHRTIRFSKLPSEFDWRWLWW